MLPLYFSQSRKFLELIYNGDKTGVLGKSPKMGKRICIFPFLTVDAYVCEEEPTIEPCKGLQMVSWHIPSNDDEYKRSKKKGWFGPFGKNFTLAKPTPFIDTEEIEYYKKWSKKKRQRRSLWIKQLENNHINVIKSDLNSFLKNYLDSNLPKNIKLFNRIQITKLSQIYNQDLSCYLVRDVKFNKIVGGLCLLKDYEINQIIYHSCFSDKTYKHIGVGMLDFAIKSSQENRLKYVNMVALNSKKNISKSWAGFTKFKLEFNPIVIYFRQIYFKIMWNW